MLVEGLSWGRSFKQNSLLVEMALLGDDEDENDEGLGGQPEAVEYDCVVAICENRR